MPSPLKTYAWPSSKKLDGYILKSTDVQGRRVGDLARILGMDEGYIKARFGAIYALDRLTPDLASAISIVGFNNDRNPNDPESFNRPRLLAAQANVFQGPSAALTAELETLYRHNKGRLIKFKFEPADMPGAVKDKDIARRFPIGAGIREYVLHRPTPFQLAWTFVGADAHSRIP